MRPLQGQLLAGLMCFLPAVAVAEPVGYIVGFDTLYRTDLATGQTVPVGPIGFSDVEGLAFAPDGTLYGVADAGLSGGSGASDLLIRINIADGSGTLVGPLAGLSGTGPSGNLDYGLAFGCDARLWLSSDTTMQLWEVTPSSGATRLVGNTGRAISGLATSAGDLYGISVDATPSLFRIDTDTAVATPIGALNVGGAVADAGLDFDGNGRLWAVLDPEPSAEGASRIARLDTTTGAGTVVANANVAAIGMEGLAIAAPIGCGNGGQGQGLAATPRQVPGPGLPLLALLAALAAAVGLRRIISA